MTNCWGIDLGGTKIEGVVVPSNDLLNPLCRLRVDTEQQGGYQHIKGQIARLVDMMADAVGERPSVIGFGTPGVTDPRTGLAKNSNTACFNGMPLQSDLERELRVRAPFSNDANCFALAEALCGAGAGAKTVFGIIMGTGCGGGVVVDGKILNGCQGIAGEWGHNILYDDGPQCYCGKRGCVERYLSGPACEQRYHELTGQPATMKELSTWADEDPAARQVLVELAQHFGRAVTYLINILDPDVIVLGGGVSNQPILYSQGAAEVKKYIFNDRVETRIVKNQLGDSAGVFGAAMMARNVMSGAM